MGLCHLTTSITLDGWRVAGHFEGIHFGRGCLLVGEGSSLVGKGWVLVVRKGRVLVVGKGWALVVGRAGRGVGVTAVKEELITLLFLTPLYTASLSSPVPPSHWDLGKTTITATGLVVSHQ